MVTLESSDLISDLIDFLEFKEWQRMQDRRDGGELHLILVKSYNLINNIDFKLFEQGTFGRVKTILRFSISKKGILSSFVL